MRNARLALLAVLYTFAVTVPATAQDVKRSIDSFSGDTIYQTKYGRLDAPHGCARANTGLMWEVARGHGGVYEALIYEWIDKDWLSVNSAALNIDDQMVPLQLARTPILGRSGQFRTERATLTLPPGTLQQLAGSKSSKVRFDGSNGTCDGTIEVNMIERIRSMLEMVR